jgi:hypothetical protein
MKLRFLVLSLIFLFVSCSQKEIIIPVIVTTDMHGTFFNTADNEHSLVQTAVFINEKRKRLKTAVLGLSTVVTQGALKHEKIEKNSIYDKNDELLFSTIEVQCLYL